MLDEALYKRFNEIVGECIKQLNENNIPYHPAYVTTSARFTKKWGLCEETALGYKITINERLVRFAEAEKGLRETIIHEYIHTCSGCMNHGYHFLRYANIMNRNCGYNIKPRNTFADKGFNPVNTGYKYFCKCEKCGKIFVFSRMCDKVRNPSDYQHSCDKGTLIPATKEEWIASLK